MKKLLLGSIFIFLSLGTFIGVSADENINKVFKIEAYDFEDLANSYYLKQYGSAIYLEDNIVYTNAHVILDDNNEPLGNYRVCKTIDFTEEPECFSGGKLLYYDIKNDIAAVEIGNANVDTVKTNDSELDIGDLIKVYGYPSNGGDTISYTEGKIAGYENGLYKIDANIDSGNSGGGVFDEDGSLVGMAVSVVVGYTTMGYIIPVSEIEDFRDKKNINSIKEYDESVNIKFTMYNMLKNNAISSNSISNNQIDINKATKYNFKIDDYTFDNDRMYYYVGLVDDENETYIWANNDYIFGEKDLTFQELYKDTKSSYIELKDDYDFEQVKIGKLELSGKDVILIFGLGNDGSVMMKFIYEISVNDFQNITIYSDNVKNKSFTNGLKLILDGMTYKEVNYATEENLIKFDNLKVAKKEGFYIDRNYSGDFLESSNDDISVDYAYVYEESIDTYEGYTLLSLVTDLYNSSKEYFYINDFGVKQNKSGDYYIYKFYRNDEYKGGTKTEYDNKYVVSVTLLDRKDDENLYGNYLSFSFNKESSKNIIDDFLYNIELTNGLPLELGEIKTSINLVEEKEFDFAE